MSDNKNLNSINDTRVIISDADQFAPAEVGEIDLYQKREKIYTRHVEGFYQRIRLFTGWPLFYGFFLLPWLPWGDRQAILFDLPERKFHILWFTFWPQDFSMLAWVLAIAAFSLFLFTTLFGRIWCGYTCPQTVWTSIFMWIEQKTEGSRNQRIKLDAAIWSGQKIIKKLLKHAMWLGFAFFTGFTFIGYFMPIHELGYQFFTASAGLMTFAWVMFFTLATYINAGWMREQLCMYVCPYARFQSAMFDKNTLIVSYDAARGESRGSRKQDADYQAEGLGDCIDCQLCVQVCPTGIDIREGLQYQCIGCALCVDACDSVMEKMDYAKGLVRYTTENQLAGLESKHLTLKTVGYTLVIMAMCGMLAYSLFSRVPLQLDVIRDRGQLYVRTDSGNIENSYTLNVINMDNDAQTYRLTVKGLDGLKILSDKAFVEFELEASEVRKIPVRLSLDSDSVVSGGRDIYFSIHSLGADNYQADKHSRFISP